MSSSLEIRLSGQIGGMDVKPDTVPLPELVHLLEHFLAAVRAEAADGLIDPNVPGFLSLASIREGSSCLVIEAGPQARPAAARITDALVRRDFSQLKYDAQEELRTAFSRIIRRGASVQLRNGQVTPVFSSADPLPPTITPQRVTEETALLAYVNRVGNHKEPNAGLKLYTALTPNGSPDLSVRLSRSLAEKMGACLFQDVTIEGEATWVTTFEPWRLAAFTVKNFTVMEGASKNGGRPLAQVFSDLAEAAHDAWDGVDPEEYVSRIRSN